MKKAEDALEAFINVSERALSTYEQCSRSTINTSNKSKTLSSGDAKSDQQKGYASLLDLPPELITQIWLEILQTSTPQPHGQQSVGPNAHRGPAGRCMPLTMTQAPAPSPSRTVSSSFPGTEASGLKDCARAACANRRLQSIFRDLLTSRQDLALQVESNIRALMEKRRLVRRLTLTHHHQYMKREVACEIGGGGTLIAMLLLSCAAWPGLCGSYSNALNFLVFTLTHVSMHTAILAGAYRAAANMGIRRALLVGLLVIVVYYCGIATLVQMACGITHVPPHLDLEPWNRPPGSTCPSMERAHTTSTLPMSFLTAGAVPDEAYINSGESCPPIESRAPEGQKDATPALSGAVLKPSAPFYPLAVLIWPLFGTSMRWRAIHVLSNSFAWCYGVWEFATSYGYIKSRNGLV